MRIDKQSSHPVSSSDSKQMKHMEPRGLQLFFKTPWSQHSALETHVNIEAELRNIKL
ncbi:UNVERIFIED_CONTAM: hypothetical protein FKN15_077356 [Acipenser sinensis]